MKNNAEFTDGIPGLSVPVDLSDASAQTDFNTKDGLIHINPTTITFDTRGNARAEFYIRHNETISLEGLRTETQCTITEDAEDYIPSSTLKDTETSANLKLSSTDTIEFVLQASSDLEMVNAKSLTVPTSSHTNYLFGVIAIVIAAAGLALLKTKKDALD